MLCHQHSIALQFGWLPFPKHPLHTVFNFFTLCSNVALNRNKLNTRLCLRPFLQQNMFNISFLTLTPFHSEIVVISTSFTHSMKSSHPLVYLRDFDMSSGFILSKVLTKPNSSKICLRMKRSYEPSKFARSCEDFVGIASVKTYALWEQRYFILVVVYLIVKLMSSLCFFGIRLNPRNSIFLSTS